MQLLTIHTEQLSRPLLCRASLAICISQRRFVPGTAPYYAVSGSGPTGVSMRPRVGPFAGEQSPRSWERVRKESIAN